MHGNSWFDRRFALVSVSTVMVMFLWTCSSTTLDEDMAYDVRVSPDEGALEAVVFPDLEANDLWDSAADLSTLDIDKELPGPVCVPGKGCFLEKCTENNQCQSGWCVEHLGEGVCSQICQDECPQGWSCKQVAGTGPDVVFICVSKFANLCKPCISSADCKSIGGVDDVCVDYGPDGDFCGGACQENDDCPWGFSCKEGKTVEGAMVKQCVADAGTCPCTAKSVALAATTSCEVENEYGKCSGTRTCTSEGLTSCNAPQPAQETCNGIDDNCDGDVDEPNLVGGDFINLCDDGNDCTEDKCAGEEGCVNKTLDGGSCNDGNPCTIADVCVDGTCIGTPVQCDDGNPCTDDVCTETGGCSFPPNSEPCDDMNPCTVGDHCVEGECQGIAIPCECQVDEDCAALDDGDLCNGTLVCDTSTLPYKCMVDPTTVVVCPEPEGENAFCLKSACDPATGQCSFVPNHEGFLCDNGNLCTVNDKCILGVCTGGTEVNCNDGNPCTDDSCAPDSGCQSVPNTAACDDGDACTIGDKCAAGTCMPGVPLACADNNPCTDDSCEPDKGCVFVPNTNPCDDGNPCTTGDKCVEGVCKGTVPAECDDGNVCTTDTCDPAKGCVHVHNQLPCDDGDLCTVGDKCDKGVCQPGTLLTCDDGNVCTDDACEPESGCVHAPNTAECDDGNACTENDACTAGWCTGTPVVCDDGNVCTTDTCDPANGCVHVHNEVPCDDGNTCTVGDKCDKGVCQPGTLLTCDDGNICTDDACEPETGCVHVPNAAKCDDGNACTENDTCTGGWCIGTPVVCQDGNLCTDDSCDPAKGCVFSHNEVPCDDGDPCTVGDKCGQGVCQPGEGKLNCDDGNVCTDDICDPGHGCTYVYNELPCDDGNVCTVEDTCGEGVCQGTLLHKEDFIQHFDWESGDVEPWTVENGGPISITTGHESQFGLQVQGGAYTRLKVTGVFVKPLTMTGKKGSFLEMAEGAYMYVDMTKPVPTGHAVYLDVYIYGKEHKSRWVCYPYDGYGHIEDLGDGWYRHYFANHHVYGYEEWWGEEPPEVPYMTVTFSSFAPSGCTMDNFVIHPNLELAGLPKECQ